MALGKGNLDTKSKQPRKRQYEGAFIDHSFEIFGIDVLGSRPGAILEPGHNMLNAWLNFIYNNMLNASNDNDLLSKDKNG